MIFVTIGSAFPFDRLIRAMDAIAATDPDGTYLAQTGSGRFRPAHMTATPSLAEDAFARTVETAEVVVSHAGMGSAITALRFGTPIVMLPRRYDQGEHTTDHQMATARWLAAKPGIFIAWSEAELPERLAEARSRTGGGDRLSPHAPPELTDRLRAAILDLAGSGRRKNT